MGWQVSDFNEEIQKQIRRQEPGDNVGPIGNPVRSVPHDHRMNKTERKYSRHLASLQQAGQIKDYLYEPFNIRLAKRTFYKPDFLVVTKDNEIEVHEVKGWWRGDAKVKIKVAAERVPWFRFKAVYHKNGRWKYEQFEPFRGS